MHTFSECGWSDQRRKTELSLSNDLLCYFSQLLTPQANGYGPDGSQLSCLYGLLKRHNTFLSLGLYFSSSALVSEAQHHQELILAPLTSLYQHQHHIKKMILSVDVAAQILQ